MSPRVVFHPGDRVRVLTPRRVVRVGYPKSLEDYVQGIRDELGVRVAALLMDVRKTVTLKSLIGSQSAREAQALQTKSAKRIIAELAYEAARADHFGGRERSLHFEDVSPLLGVVGVVNRLRTVKTGTYFPPSGSSGAFCDDYQPGGLANEKTHRLVEIIATPPFIPDSETGICGCGRKLDANRRCVGCDCKRECYCVLLWPRSIGDKTAELWFLTTDLQKVSEA